MLTVWFAHLIFRGDFIRCTLPLELAWDAFFTCRFVRDYHVFLYFRNILFLSGVVFATLGWPLGGNSEV